MDRRKLPFLRPCDTFSKNPLRNITTLPFLQPFLIFFILANVISCRCDAGISHEFLHFHNIYVFTDEASSKRSSEIVRCKSAFQVFGFRDKLNKNESDAGFVFGRIDNKQRLHLDIALDPSSVTRIIKKLVSEFKPDFQNIKNSIRKINISLFIAFADNFG